MALPARRNRAKLASTPNPLATELEQLMRYDPRRAHADEQELLRSREEMARLQAENARLVQFAQHASQQPSVPYPAPTNSTPAYGRMAAVRMPPQRTVRPTSHSARQRTLITVAIAVAAFLFGFLYANALSGGAAIRQLEATDGMLPWS